MNTVPGFTAEASLFSSGRCYYVFASKALESATTVQMSRATGPFGPIGLPGQDCDAACEHICRTFGGGGIFYDRCKDSCRSTCVEHLQLAVAL
jgi:hypothetical protein